MARYDIEDAIGFIVEQLQTSLNDKINAINTDKGDSLLVTVPVDGFVYRKNGKTNKTYTSFVYYEAPEEVEFEEGQSIRQHYAKTYFFEMGIGFRNNDKYANTSIDNFKRVIRYQKAMEEALVSIGSVRGYSNLEINTIQSSSEEREEGLTHISAFTISLTIGG